jgi:molybdopterin-containing oxidoreductase family iron-sulfur binding subunit
VLHVATFDEYKKDPRFAHEEEGVEEPDRDYTLYPNYPYNGYKWGMSIDMNKCVGCNACILACQSENNIPVVGKEQCRLGRHMHWLRVDAYYQGDRDNPKMYFMPVPCMQCENAPCELVCPVGATVHSTEGLNDMVYNRCVGTRYCSNNCPYKVRRFNFLLFQDWDTQQYKMMRNPDVSVRSRGVMEKCTYCVQRINERRIDAERENRKINEGEQSGELQTACQQSCPAGAITFGNINDPNSQVSKWKAQNRNYGLLADLNTRPRTTYLAEVRNPNPELEAERS